MSADAREALTGTVVADENTEVGGGELGSLLRAPSSRTRAAGAAAMLGRIVAVEAGGGVRVEVPGAPGARMARLAVPLSADDLLAARESGGSAVLVFENGDPALPIVVGLLPAATPTRAPATPAHASESRSASDPARPAAGPHSDHSDMLQVLEADVDGKRVRITAQDEIVLECGSASITLRRNGRVVVRGTYVESYSDGTNRIKGGQVRIN